MPIVVRIDVELAKRKMSVGEFAKRVGLTPANVAVLKNGRAKAVRFSTLEAMCRVLDCQPGDLLEWSRTTTARHLPRAPTRSPRQPGRPRAPNADDLSFDVEPGKVTGFLGPSGAGRSTAAAAVRSRVDVRARQDPAGVPGGVPPDRGAAGMPEMSSVTAMLVGRLRSPAPLAAADVWRRNDTHG